MSLLRADAATTVNRQILACYPAGVAWPAVALSVACIAGFVIASTLSFTGVWPYWIGPYVNSVLLARLFAPFHECMHGNISGRDTNAKWLNATIGHIAGVLLFFEFSMVRHLHVAHHRAVNVPGRDPDLWIQTQNRWLAAIKSPTVVPRYLLLYIRDVIFNPRVSDRAALARFARLIGLYGGAAMLLAVGPWVDVLALWILPAMLVTGLTAFLHWTLHTPHREDDDFAATRIIIGKGWRGRLMGHIYAYQNHHLIHHLFPRLPYYRHADAFRLIRSTLEGLGARITDFGR